jgi:hypothetical protein
MNGYSLSNWEFLSEEEREYLSWELQEKQIRETYIRSLSLWELIKLKLRR